MSALRKAILSAGGVALGAWVVYINLTVERATGPVVEVEAVQRRHLEAVVSAAGTIVPRLTVDISANVMGRVTRLEFNEGERVAAGQLLLEVDGEALRAAVERGEAAVQASRSSRRQAEVEVGTAGANLELARDNLERQERLWGLGLVAREGYERAVNDVAVREAELEARELEVATQAQRIRQEESSLKSAQYELSKATITSPIAGVVTRRNIEEGETVVVGTMNSRGTVLATVADLSVIEAEVEVDETDIYSIELGQIAIVKMDALPEQDFSGIVTEIGNSPIGPSGSRVAAVFKVVVTLERTIRGVRPGFTCTADITTAVRADSLALPIQAATVRELVLDANGNVVRQSGRGRRGVARGVSAGEGAELRARGTEGERREGVFVARGGRAVFTPVDTASPASATSRRCRGWRKGDLIVIGPFSEVRNLNDRDSIRVVENPPRD